MKSLPPQTSRATADWLARAEAHLAAQHAVDQLAAQGVALLGAARAPMTLVRTLIWFVLAAAAMLAAVWLAERPGTVTVDFRGWRLDTSVGVLLIARRRPDPARRRRCGCSIAGSSARRARCSKAGATAAAARAIAS